MIDILFNEKKNDYELIQNTLSSKAKNATLPR